MTTKRKRGRPTVYEPATKIRFEVGTSRELDLLLERAVTHELDQAWLKTRPALIRELVRRGIESVNAQLDDEAGPQQVRLFSFSSKS